MNISFTGVLIEHPPHPVSPVLFRHQIPAIHTTSPALCHMRHNVHWLINHTSHQLIEYTQEWTWSIRTQVFTTNRMAALLMAAYQRKWKTQIAWPSTIQKTLSKTGKDVTQIQKELHFLTWIMQTVFRDHLILWWNMRDKRPLTRRVVSHCHRLTTISCRRTNGSRKIYQSEMKHFQANLVRCRSVRNTEKDILAVQLMKGRRVILLPNRRTSARHGSLTNSHIIET